MTERTFLDRFLAAIPALVAGIVLLALLFWQASQRKAPTIFSDELEWTQISRAIAATGHAARRGEPISFKSLYAFLIAPAWWIHSTRAAYDVAKYIGMFTMALAAIPTYVLARMLVAPRVAAVAALASISTSAMFYGGYLLPETLAYPFFALCACLCIGSLAGRGRRWTIAAILASLAATQVRDELSVVLAAYAAAAIVLWLCGPRFRRLSAEWTVRDWIGASVLALGALIVVNRLASTASTEYAVVTQTWQHRMWSLGFQAGSAFTLGLGIVPVVCGLAALWLPERRADPAWRAFAAFTASAIFVVGAYTGVKAAYLSTVLATRVEERNLIYLGPLLIVGAAVYLTARRVSWPAVAVAWLFAGWLVTAYGYQLDYPYFEAPGYGIAALANRSWSWDASTIRTWVYVAVAVAGVVALLPLVRERRLRTAAVATAALASLTWMLAGEITAANGAANGSRQYYGNLPKPVDWVDREAGAAGVTFLGDNINQGESLGINLYEFFNRRLLNIWSLDGSAPPPGPTRTPDLASADGTLRSDPGLPYVLETPAVDMAGRVVDTRGGYKLVAVTRPWRLRQVTYGLSGDGWIASATGETTSASGGYAYFGPGTQRGTLRVSVDRLAFCHNSAGTNVVVKIGPVALNEQRAAVVDRPEHTYRFHLADCATHPIVVEARPPVAVQVSAAPLTSGQSVGLSDNRYFGVRAGFSFTPAKR